MPEIKAIETVYHGYRFRSRLEARWAVFFDAVHLDYQYELEGFVGLEGQMYLPDFYFPDFDCYAEVKGNDEFLRKDAQKIAAAIDFDATPVSEGLIILGDIPDPDKISWGNIPAFYYLHCNKGIETDLAAFMLRSQHDKCEILKGELNIFVRLFSYGTPCGRTDYYASSEYIDPKVSTTCRWTHKDLRSFDFEALKAAYTKARQARFEHGETPNLRR